MNGLLLSNSVEKSCLTGSLVLLCYNRRSQPVVMKISPFRTSCRTDLKSQIFITAWSSTCVKKHQKKATACKAGQVK